MDAAIGRSRRELLRIGHTACARTDAVACRNCCTAAIRHGGDKVIWLGEVTGLCDNCVKRAKPDGAGLHRRSAAMFRPAQPSLAKEARR